MPTFRFEASDGAGVKRSGVEDAPTLAALTARLRERGLLVLRAGSAEDHAGRLRWPVRGIDLEVGLKQLSVMLRSGVTLLEGLQVLARQARRPTVHELWRDIADRIQRGSNLADALAHQRVVGPLVVQLARVGEQTGELERSLVRAAEALERRRRLRASVLGALFYPLLVMLLTAAVALFLVLKVLPQLREFLRGLGRELPPLTRTLISITEAAQAHALHAAVLLPLLVLAAWAIYRHPPARREIDRGLLMLPIVGRVIRLGGTVELSRGLSALLGGGITLFQSLATTEQLLGNAYVRELVVRARDRVLAGEALHPQLVDPRAFTAMLPAMVAVGESTGALDEVLAEVAGYHEEELQGLIRTLSALVEPALILVAGVVVGFVYLALFMAIYPEHGGPR